MIMGYTFQQVLFIAIVVAGAIAITVIILRQLKVEIPAWIAQIALILAVVFVGILALRFLFSMARGL